MVQKELKIGDRVVVNSRSTTQEGSKGTVKYISGGQVYLVLDDVGQVPTGFAPWLLDPIT